jgi:hypothetical protein
LSDPNIVIGGIPTKWEGNSPASVEQSTSILSTARSSQGSTLSHDPTGDDIVTVQGVSMKLATAEKHGWITRTPDGRYTDVSPEALKAAVDATAPPKPEEPTFDRTHDALGDAQIEEIGALSKAIEGIGQNPAAVIGTLLANPEKPLEAITTLARERGMDEATLHAEVISVARGVESALNTYLTDKVKIISPEQIDAFWSYTWKTFGKSAVISASLQAVYKGDARPFAMFAERFARAQGRGRGDATNVKKVPGHYAGMPDREVVTIDGKRMTLGAARRLGLA